MRRNKTLRNEIKHDRRPHQLKSRTTTF